MQTTSINISIDVPVTGNYNLDELQRKLKAYALQLIRFEEKTQKTVSVHKHSLSSLRGIGEKTYTEEQLLNEYLSNKYGV